MTRFAERFVLERDIAAGGMAHVFLGKDEVLDRPVAVKVLDPAHGGTEIGSRFQREGRTAARLSHPNIVQVYDAGEGEFEGHETSYIVMEYVPGGDLKQLVDQRGPLPDEELAKVGADISSGLAHAHRKGVVHRNIKPQNILIDSYGRPKLADFGIARALDATHATQTGSYLGTALYSSPEQLQGEKVTPKSDIYFLGVTLYYAAAGKPPFTGTPIEVASQQISKDPVPPRERGASISADLETLILRCLAKDPAGRPDAEDLNAKLLQTFPTTTAPTVLAGVAEAARSLKTAGFAGATRASRAAGSAGRAAVARWLDRPANPKASRVSAGMAVAPGRTFRPGWDRRVLLVAGVAALLLLLGAVGVVAMLGTEELSSAGSADQPTSEGGSEVGTGSLTAETAASRVVETYLAIVERDYERSYGFLSEGYKQSTYPSQEDWRTTVEPLVATRFLEDGVPTAQISGGEAMVTGKTQTIYTDSPIETYEGTWTLVDEGGEWKISDMDAPPKTARRSY